MNILYKSSYIIRIFGIFPFIIFLFYSILQLISHKYLGGFMRNLLSSKEKRQLELMEFLVTSDEWTHLKNLAEKFICTERILKQDLAELREIFPQITIHSSTNGIKAKFDRIVSKIVKEMNPHYQISIQLTPVSITGNEIDIRYFYAQYFSERYHFLEWPFSDFDEEDLNDFAKYFYAPTNYPMGFAIFHMYKWMIMIGIYRVKNQHFVPIPDNFYDEVFPLYEQLPDLEEKLTYFSNKFQIEITPEILAQIFISFIQESIFLSPEEFYHSLNDSDYAQKSYRLLDEMLSKIENRIHIQFHNRNDLIWYMHNTVHLERQETFTDPLLFNQKQKTIQNFEFHFSEVFQIMKEEIVQYLKIMNRTHTPEHINHLMYTLFTHGEDTAVQLLMNRPPVKVLVISNFDHALSITLTKILSYYCNNRFIFENWTQVDLSTEILNQTDYDIIVANFYIEGLTKEFICHNNLTIMELVNYLNTLSNSF